MKNVHYVRKMNIKPKMQEGMLGRLKNGDTIQGEEIVLLTIITQMDGESCFVSIAFGCGYYCFVIITIRIGQIINFMTKVRFKVCF